jgi:hypothetical protein
MKRVILCLVLSAPALGGVADPQCKTDHPWYPGELSCSTWDRLFRTQAALYERVTGTKVAGDEDKALAAWYWRNLNYFHCTVGKEDVWDKGLEQGEEGREYWTGLFGYGYGLCYTTHHQWAGEMRHLLGANRCRAMGVAGHTTFEVWLTGGPYGEGRWALLDHDVSTVVFTPDGQRLLGLMEVSRDMSSIQNGSRERGFIPGGLHPSDPGAYKRVEWAGYTTGYAGPPPRVHLRAGEMLRRYVQPGLDDGKTFVYWGINYNTRGIPGPERAHTWVNQPEKMHKSLRDAGYKPGQGRYANAVYTYLPDFATGTYKEGVVEESADHVTFEWVSCYVVAAAPPKDLPPKERWGIYKPGCTGGLVLHGRMTCPVAVSTDCGKTWQACGNAADGMDLTDRLKGHRQYLLRFGAGAKALAGTGLTITTVCQCSPTVIPRVKPGRNEVTYESSGRAVCSAGPNLAQAKAHLVDGAMGSPKVTLELAAPRGAKAVHVYAAARAQSGAPPRPSKYNIDCSTDGGKTWRPVLSDWQIVQRKPEPNDWWSQTFPFGDAPLPRVAGPIRVRFINTANRSYMRAEAHLVYEVPNTSLLEATFAWRDAGEVKTATHMFTGSQPGRSETWSFQAGQKPQTFWVQYAAK